MIRDFIAAELRPAFSDNDLFTQVNELQGEVFREVERRRTLKVHIGGKPYFLKIHHGVGWGEIFKNLFQGRLPVLGARNEWLAIKRLTECDVPTMTASLYCERGSNPAELKSAIMTESLEATISLEDHVASDHLEKRCILEAVAGVAGAMHRAGVNHRDFYLCHLLMPQPQSHSPDLSTPGRRFSEPKLHLIDLHRAQIREHVPDRWLIKDLGGLLFSAFDKDLTRRDLLRFVRTYSDKPLRQALANQGFWKRVLARARKLYLQDHDSLPDNIEKLLTPTGHTLR